MQLSPLSGFSQWNPRAWSILRWLPRRDSNGEIAKRIAVLLPIRIVLPLSGFSSSGRSFTKQGRCWEYSWDWKLFILFVFHEELFYFDGRVVLTTVVFNALISFDPLWPSWPLPSFILTNAGRFLSSTEKGLAHKTLNITSLTLYNPVGHYHSLDKVVNFRKIAVENLIWLGVFRFLNVSVSTGRYLG